MYTQRIIHIAALGKGPDLRAALEERNKEASSSAPHSLQTRMFSSEPAFVHVLRFENLAAIEAYQDRSQVSSPAFIETGRKITQALAQPQTTELYETLAPAQFSGTPKYSMRIKHFPGPGKGPELRKLLEERVAKSIPGCLGAGLSTQVAPPEGAAFVITRLFASLAGMDEFRAANQGSALDTWANQVAAVSGRPNQQEMLRILAPFPS